MSIGRASLIHDYKVTQIFVSFQGDVHEEEVRSDEEGLRAKRVVRLRDLDHHLQLAQQALPVRLVGHGQGLAQVHR